MSNMLKTTALLGAFTLTAGIAGPALAQDATAAAAPATAVPVDSVFIFNTLLLLIGGFLVMWMGAGFAMLEAGLVRTKNVTMQLTKNVVLFSIAGLFYYLIGYNLMYPGDAWLVTGIIGNIAPAVLEPVHASGDQISDIGYASVGSDFFYQVMFCATTASIVSGTLAERIKLWPFVTFTVILTALIYPIAGSWKWGGGFLGADNGLIASMFGQPFQDFAGSTIVHSIGGWAALAGALILGPRIGKYTKDGKVMPFPGSSLPLATLGTFILWLGWFGFNGASQLALGSISDAADVSRIFANTNAAAAGGAIAAMVATQLIYGKIDLTMVLNGALAGLVSITAEPLFPSIGAATLIGIIGGVIVVFAVPMLDKFKIDDVVGAIPVHLCAGIWGTIAVAFTNPDSTFGGQILSIIIIGAFVFIVSLVLWVIINGIIGIRASQEEEMEGLDSAELGLEAYPEFGKGSQFV